MKNSLLTLTSTFALVVVLSSTSNIYAADSTTGDELAAQPAQELSTVKDDAEMKTETDEILAQAEKETAAVVKPLSLEGLKGLVDSGSFDKAYAQGQEMLFDFEGEADFDLLYGTAAVEVGENKEAIFIFERLTEAEPSNVRYQLELGRAYYQHGEKEKAKAIFESVLVSEQGLPENVETRILAYLDAISSGSNFGDPAKAEALKGFVGIAAGYDSNVNAASDAKIINAYINGFVFPTANGTKEESSAYVAHQIAGAYVKPLGERTAIDMKVYATNRKNGSGLSDLDSGMVYFELGNRWRFEKGLANFAVRYSGVTLGHEDLYDYSSFSASWAQPVSWEFADSLSLEFSTGAIRYADSVNSSRDINPTNFTVGGNKQIDKLIHGLNFQYGMDDAQGSHDFRDPGGVLHLDIAADHYSRNYFGLGYSLSYIYDTKTTIYGALNYQTSSYEEEDHDFFNSKGEWTKRDGDLTAITIGSRYNWNKQLQFRASATMLNVTSEIDLYEYSRNKLEVGAGYQL